MALKVFQCQATFSDNLLSDADWKKAIVSAIYKKGQQSDPKNYRPVSLTTLTCKVMKHIVCSHLSGNLSANSIITPLQHGFDVACLAILS